MERRKFLQNLAVATASARILAGSTAAATEPLKNLPPFDFGEEQTGAADVEGHTPLGEFKQGTVSWKVYEDLRTRDGAITFVSSTGRSRVLPKNAEATFPQAETPYLGLKLEDVGMSGPDVLADKLLANGDPDEEQVRLAAPPVGWFAPPPPPTPGAPPRPANFNRRAPWDNFIGTKECFDTQPVFPQGNTKTYHPIQYIPEITAELADKRFEGLVGGWLPAIRKVFPINDSSYYEVVVFGDPRAHDKFIVQSWHRTSQIEDGKVTQVFYGHSYPAYPPRREDPKPEEFYEALLAFAQYWDGLLHEGVTVSVPEKSWSDMARYAFVKELMVRPDGKYPKYGAVDRDYAGSEYDGFQDIYTMAVYANLEWGRLEMARTIIDQYMSENTDDKGNINMRGPETAQYGLTLSLLARYYNYTHDAALLTKYREKIEATASLLTQLHDISLKLPQDDPGYGLIHGWSESDSCLNAQPMTWWLPYYGNSAFAARGFKDLAPVWQKLGHSALAAEWLKRSKTLQEATVAAIRKNTHNDMKPPYIGPYAGAEGTFREAYEGGRGAAAAGGAAGATAAAGTAAARPRRGPNPQQWAHRAYAETLQPDMLPADMSNMVIDCMRAYGATTIGVVANVEPPNPRGRAILGFISYGYASQLLRLDRIEEYLLFLYAHRYHDHTPGSWTAGEVCGITGGMPLFCIPAQQTIPLLVRWMLAIEDNDEERLYLGKALPREWVGSGKELGISNAPTRWGKVSFKLAADTGAKKAKATVELTGASAPKELYVKFRLPVGNTLQSATANGKTVKIGGEHNDTAIVPTGAAKHFEVVAQFS